MTDADVSLHPQPRKVPTDEGPVLEFIRLSPDALVPFRAYGASAAYDISANLIGSDRRPRTASIGSGITQTIPTGLAVRPPHGCVVLVCSRSGFATQGVFVANAPGVLDPDYTGEIGVILTNAGLKPFYIKHGERIAQLLVIPYLACDLQEVTQFPSSGRGDRGFGSTGR